jgi:hypothetical protein
MNKRTEFSKVRKTLKARLWKGAQKEIADKLLENGVKNISAQVIRNYFSGLSVDIDHVPLIVATTKTVIKERTLKNKKILKSMQAAL